MTSTDPAAPGTPAGDPAATMRSQLRTPAAASATGPVDLSAAVLVEAARAAAAQASPDEALHAVIDMAVQTGPCDAASITMLGPGKTVDTVAASDARIEEADRLQYEHGEGPGLDATWTDGVFLIPDLTADRRWPNWAERATELGIGASLSVHLFTDATLGSLNLYSQTPRDFTDTDIENARVIAAQASVILAYTRTQQDLWRTIDSLAHIRLIKARVVAERYAGGTVPRASRPRLTDEFLPKIEEWVEESKGKIRDDVAHDKPVVMGFTGSELKRQSPVGECAGAAALTATSSPATARRFRIWASRSASQCRRSMTQAQVPHPHRQDAGLHRRSVSSIDVIWMRRGIAAKAGVSAACQARLVSRVA